MYDLIFLLVSIGFISALIYPVIYASYFAFTGRRASNFLKKIFFIPSLVLGTIVYYLTIYPLIVLINRAL